MMSHGFLLALQCFLVSHHVMSCSILFSLVFFRVFLCNLMPFDASSWVRMPSGADTWQAGGWLSHTVQVSFWAVFSGKFSLGPMRKMARLKWNLFKRIIMKSKNWTPNAKRCIPWGTNQKQQKGTTLYFVTMKCTCIQTWITFTRYTIHGSAGVCFQQSTIYQPEHARRTCKQYIISSWKAS